MAADFFYRGGKRRVCGKCHGERVVLPEGNTIWEVTMNLWLVADSSAWGPHNASS
jgi:hypothetical protein